MVDLDKLDPETRKAIQDAKVKNNIRAAMGGVEQDACRSCSATVWGLTDLEYEKIVSRFFLIEKHIRAALREDAVDQFTHDLVLELIYRQG